MPYSKFDNLKLIGISSVVPKRELSLENDTEIYGGDKNKIERVIKSSGFLKRRVADPDVMASDLCYEAANDLIKNLSLNKNKIDAILFVGYTKDYIMPATAYSLHKRLGLSRDCIVLDIPQACSGYIIGLHQAAMLLNSCCNNVLLLVGDCFSKFHDLFRNKTAPIFGDAGSATFLVKEKMNDPTYINIFSDGAGFESFTCKNGGFRHPPQKDLFYDDGLFKYEAQMLGKEIFDFTVKEVATSILSILKLASYDKEDINFYIMHQANKVILQTIATQIGILSSKIPMRTITEFGNQCGASIPCTLSNELSEQLSKSKLKLCLSGFGVGLSWGNAIITTDMIYCSNILEYQGNSNE